MSHELIERDLKTIWHPCSQMKDFQFHPPLLVQSASGSYLYTDRGPIIDAISSWWCKSLGHGHPAIIAAIKSQLDSFEHVISANTTHPILVELGEKLCEISKNQHVFFASDGSSAVEIALKLALHSCQIKGNHHKKEIITLENSYHGETLGTLSISDLGLYKKPYLGLGVKAHFLHSIPYVSDKSDPLWEDCSETWPTVFEQLEGLKEKTAALIVEPLVQGAGGMLCYSADFLRQLALWAEKNDIYFIADEIMTGIGRTGQWLSCDHAGVQADLICLSKGLTSGSLPLSCVLIKNSIFELFYDDYEKGNSFLHSHTYSANALALSAALATLRVIESEGIIEQAENLGRYMHKVFHEIASLTGKLTQVRTLGALVAADLENNGNQRLGYALHLEALQRGALLRPLGNSLYWLPPLNASIHTIEHLAEITLGAIEAIYR